MTAATLKQARDSSAAVWSSYTAPHCSSARTRERQRLSASKDSYFTVLLSGRRVFKGHNLAVCVGRTGAMFLHTAPLLGAPRGEDVGIWPPVGAPRSAHTLELLKHPEEKSTSCTNRIRNIQMCPNLCAECNLEVSWRKNCASPEIKQSSRSSCYSSWTRERGLNVRACNLLLGQDAIYLFFILLGDGGSRGSRANMALLVLFVELSQRTRRHRSIRSTDTINCKPPLLTEAPLHPFIHTFIRSSIH